MFCPNRDTSALNFRDYLRILIPEGLLVIVCFCFFSEPPDSGEAKAPSAPRPSNVVPEFMYNDFASITYFYYFYFQQEEMLNALETTLLLGVKFKSYEVLDVLLQYFAQQNGIGNFQLPMSVDLFKLIKIITAEDESKLSLAIVNSTNQIRAKCDFKVEDMSSLLKDNLQQWEFVKDSEFVKEVSTVFL